MHSPEGPRTQIVGFEGQDTLMIMVSVRPGDSCVTLRVPVANNWVLGVLVIVIIEQVLGKYMIIGYLDPEGKICLDHRLGIGDLFPHFRWQRWAPWILCPIIPAHPKAWKGVLNKRTKPRSWRFGVLAI